MYTFRSGPKQPHPGTKSKTEFLIDHGLRSTNIIFGSIRSVFLVWTKNVHLYLKVQQNFNFESISFVHDDTLFKLLSILLSLLRALDKKTRGETMINLSLSMNRNLGEESPFVNISAS